MSNTPPPLGSQPDQKSWRPSWTDRLGISIEEEEHKYALTYPPKLKEDFKRNFLLISTIYMSLFTRDIPIDDTFEEDDGKVRISKTIQLEIMSIYKITFNADGSYYTQDSPYSNGSVRDVYFEVLKSVVDELEMRFDGIKMSFDDLRAIVDRFFYYDPFYSRFVLICPVTEEEFSILIPPSSDYSNLPTAITVGLGYSNFKELHILGSAAEVGESLKSAKVVLEQLGEEDPIPNYNLREILNRLYREFISARDEYKDLSHTSLFAALRDSNFKAAFIQANEEFLSRMFIGRNSEIPTTVFYLPREGEVTRS